MSLFDILAGTSDGVFAVNRRQRIVFWNTSARQMLGFEPESVLGRPCYELLGGKDESGCTKCRKGCETLDASLRGKLSPTTDLHVHTAPEGGRWINFTTFLLPSRYHDLSLLAHVFRDGDRAWRTALPSEHARGGTLTQTELDSLPRRFEPLTRAENKILRLLACGASTDTICSRLDIHKTTVRTHVQHIMAKLGTHTRLEAVACAMRNDLLRFSTD